MPSELFIIYSRVELAKPNDQNILLIKTLSLRWPCRAEEPYTQRGLKSSLSDSRNLQVLRRSMRSYCCICFFYACVLSISRLASSGKCDPKRYGEHLHRHLRQQLLRRLRVGPLPRVGHYRSCNLFLLYGVDHGRLLLVLSRKGRRLLSNS